MAGITIRDLPGDYSFGARVDGVTWDNIHDEELRARLNALFEERGVIVFENMEPSSKMHLELSRVFGPIKDHPTKTVPRAAEDEDVGVIDLYRTPDETNEEFHGVPIVNGEPRQSWLPWHFDHTYNDELNRAGVLRSVERVDEGGVTGFLDGVALYEAFPKDLRARIEGKEVAYRLETQYDQLRFGKPAQYRTIEPKPSSAEFKAQADAMPRAIHPAVWTRPTGEKVLHVSNYMAEGIVGMENDEGDSLLEEVCQTINRLGDSCSYHHKWRDGDMVVWDNTRMLHCVSGSDPDQLRVMYRTTIKGDYGLGRWEGGAQPAAAADAMA
jgi:taurine dioxygenase